MMKKLNLKWFVPGLIAGAVAGFFYWKFYGCDGTCLITSGPVRSMLYFALMGALVNNMFKPQLIKKIEPGEVSNNN